MDERGQSLSRLQGSVQPDDKRKVMEREELKVHLTKGVWNIEYQNDVGPMDEGFWEWLEVGPAQVHGDPKDLQVMADSALIAEAGDVANETGMWPRDMVAEIERLKRLLDKSLAQTDELIAMCSKP